MWGSSIWPGSTIVVWASAEVHASKGLYRHVTGFVLKIRLVIFDLWGVLSQASVTSVKQAYFQEILFHKGSLNTSHLNCHGNLSLPLVRLVFRYSSSLFLFLSFFYLKLQSCITLFYILHVFIFSTGYKENSQYSQDLIPQAHDYRKAL